MANIKKSFNFRNGVQVDEDNLLVTPTGLVGIGTTVPTEALDVVGNLIVSGVTSTTLAQTGILTVTTLIPTEIIGSGVSISSGVITSTGGGGIVTFFGDGQYLENLPTTQFVSSSTGIALTSQNCGIGTTNAISTLQVGGDPNTQPKGVGISSYGDIKATGIITATAFVGPLTGAVTGNVTGNADSATLASAATVLQTARNIGGVSFDGSADITLPGVNSSGNQNTSGTATNLSGSPNITVSGVDLNGNLDVSGNTTLGDSSSDTLTVNSTSTFTQPITGATGQNKIPSLYSAMTDLPSPSTYHGMFAHVHATGRGYFSHAGGWYELVNKETSGKVGTGTETYNVGLLGVGANSPANDIQVRKTGNAEIQVTSETGVAGLTVGRETGVLDTNNAEIRYAADNLGQYSSEQSLDIINYGTGNFNYHLSANNPNAYQGDFHWHRGINNQRLMTLTGIGGSLGVGTTLPSTELDVFGDGTFSGNVTVGNDLTLAGQLTVPVVNSDVNGNIVGNVDGNINATAGVSTFYNLRATGVSTFLTTKVSTLGIGIDPSTPLSANSSETDRFFVAANGDVGIKTTNTQGNSLLVAGSIVGQIIGAGTTQALSTVDFSLAGQGLGGAFANKMFMIPPKVTSAQKSSLAGLTGGAFIYNTSVNKLEVYNGSAWAPLETNTGGGEENQFAFSNIAVSGQTTVEADAKQDTVTFVGGSNMTITTNATGDEITFASSGGGGGGGTVTSVTGTAPIESSGGNTPAISITAATQSAAGSMSAADKVRLDAMDDNAADDQTSTEIKALLAGDNLTDAHLAQNSVGSSEIKDGAVDALQLANTSVSAGAYTNADITVDAQGRLTAATSGKNHIISSWNVTASGLNYRFTGPGNLTGTQNNPKLFLVRGQKYEFDLNAGSHPFHIRVSDQGSDYTNGVTTVGNNQTGKITFDVPMDAPSVLYYQCDTHPSQMIGTIDIASPPKQIQSLQGTTAQINDNAYAELNITGYKVYSLFKIASNHDALVRVYVDDASRDADTTRSEGQDPNPGIGLIAEARTSGGTILVTPGAMGFNNDSPQTNNIYLGVTNRSGSPQQIQVTLTAIQIGE